MNNRNKNDRGSSKWIGLVLVLLFSQPMLVIPLAVFGGILYVAIQLVKNSQSGTRTSTVRSSSRQEKFDDCPQSLFCFHKDKGEHHVKRGKEIDPWDRPDIDISKYQRKE